MPDSFEIPTRLPASPARIYLARLNSEGHCAVAGSAAKFVSVCRRHDHIFNKEQL